MLENSKSQVKQYTIYQMLTNYEDHCICHWFENCLTFEYYVTQYFMLINA